MRRTLTSLLAALFMLAASGMPAAAGVNGSGTWTGTMDFGQHFRNQANTFDTDCNKGSVKDVWARGQGLYAPPPAGPLPKNGVWSLHTSFTALVTGISGGLRSVTGTLDACGWLTHTGRAGTTARGPDCLMSKGHSGTGVANFSGGDGVNLFDLQWKSTAGHAYPLLGKYQAWAGTKANKDKKNKWGNFSAMAHVPKGLPCLENKGCPNQKSASPGTAGCGAQSTAIVGSFTLAEAGDSNGNGRSNEKKDVLRPNNVPTQCKDSAAPPTVCLYDTKKGNGKETPKPKPAG